MGTKILRNPKVNQTRAARAIAAQKEVEMEYRIKKTQKQKYEVYINDKLDKTFVNLELALDYIKWVKEMK